MTPLFDIKELIALMRAGTSEQAIPHLEHITQKLPTHVAAHALLAQAYTNERRYEEARVAWQNALFLMPNSPSIKKGFRRVLKELAKQKFAQATPVPVADPEDVPAADALKQDALDQPLPEPESPFETDEQPDFGGEPILDHEELSEAIDESSIEEQDQFTPDIEQPDVAEEPILQQDEQTAAEDEPALAQYDQPVSEELPILEIEQPEAEEEPVQSLDEQPVLVEVPDSVDEEQPADEELSNVITPGGDQSPPASESAALTDLEQEDPGQTPSFEGAAPSMLINPSSHHNVTPVEIEASLPDNTEEHEHAEDDSDDGLAFEDDIPLPVITVPTPQPTSSAPPSNLPDIPVPPILAPLVKDSDGWHEDQELDHLIQELESARIIPKPDHEHIEAPALDDNVEDMVSETLARIFEGQKQHMKAADMYDKLADIHPERSKKFKDKAAELRALQNDSSNQVHETDTDES